MRYNINKKKFKFNLTSLVILFYMFLNFFMNNLYKYKHNILVILITIWLFWYIKYSSKIKEGIKCWFGRCKKRKKPKVSYRELVERAMKKLLGDKVKKYNKDIVDACYDTARAKYNNFRDILINTIRCYAPYDVKLNGFKIEFNN